MRKADWTVAMSMNEQTAARDVLQDHESRSAESDPEQFPRAYAAIRPPAPDSEERVRLAMDVELA